MLPLIVFNSHVSFLHMLFSGQCLAPLSMTSQCITCYVVVNTVCCLSARDTPRPPMGLQLGHLPLCDISVILPL